MNVNSFEPRSAWKMAIDPIATGKAWRRKRIEVNLSQADLSLIFELAEMDINMSKSAISAVENGKHKPSLDHAFFFAGLCGCPVEDLVVTYRRSRGADDRDQVAPLIISYSYVLDEHLQSQVLVFFHGKVQVNTDFRNR